VLDKRPSYNDYFSFITKLFGEQDNINVVSNLDVIVPTETLVYSSLYLLGKSCLALTRWDINNPIGYKQNSSFLNRPDSQDTWIFKGAVPQIAGATFTLGMAGCLCGDTEIIYSRGARSGGRKIKIKDLYKRFNGKTKDWNLKHITKIHSLDVKEDYIFYNKILSVIESGIKKTIKITFEDNSHLILTPDHKICNINKEFIEAEKFKVGDCVMSKGDMKMKKTKDNRIYAERKVVYVKYHPFAEKKNVRGYLYKRVRRYRLVYEASLNNMNYEDFIHCLNNNMELSNKLKFLDSKIEIHHKDGNTINDSIENLEVLTKEEHAKIHSSKKINHKQHLSEKKIIKIEDYKETMTYDISVEYPNNNFCANDIIVHNCDNKIGHLLEKAGYDVKNPSKTLRTFHYHTTNVRNYLDIVGFPIERIPPPYKIMPPTE
jgi:hypothetical protein